MQPDANLQAIAKDLNILIEELETNPRLSYWTIRLVLKSIKEKAEKAAEISQIRAELQTLLELK